MNNIVPFGKYKGQPVEVMLADMNYMNWILEQGFVEKQYPEIHALIINNFGEPEEPPEHNRFQADFFNDEYLKKFLDYMVIPPAEMKRMLLEYKPVLNQKKNDVLANSKPRESVDEMKNIEEEYEWDLRNCPADYSSVRIEPELCGWDIVLNEMSHFGYTLYPFNKKCPHKFSYDTKFCLELKPTIGDDYPAVIRQMKNNVERVKKKCGSHLHFAFFLIYKDFQATSITESEMKTIFQKAGFHAVSEKEYVVQTDVTYSQIAYTYEPIYGVKLWVKTS